MTLAAVCQGTNSHWESDFLIVAAQRCCTSARTQSVQMTEFCFGPHFDSVIFKLMSRRCLGRSRLPSQRAPAEKQRARTRSEKHIVTSSLWEEAAKLRVRVSQQSFSCPTHSLTHRLSHAVNIFHTLHQATCVGGHLSVCHSKMKVFI